MKQFTKEQLETFLRAIDDNLDTPFEIIIIGGTAAALGYKVTTYTRDIDTAGDVTAIQVAYEKAIKQTGLNIPLGPAGVYDAPYHYEDRLQASPISNLKYLNIRLPERYDLALMKMLRGQEHDMATIREIHQNAPFSFETFIALMSTEMTHVTGNKKDILLNFLVMIETLFGETKAQQAQRELRNWASR